MDDEAAVGGGAGVEIGDLRNGWYRRRRDLDEIKTGCLGLLQGFPERQNTEVLPPGADDAQLPRAYLLVDVQSFYSHLMRGL